MKKSSKKLSLNRETVRGLSNRELGSAAGGVISARSCNDTLLHDNCCWKPGPTFEISCFVTRCFCPV